jgi:hypothetical protein
VFLDVLGSLLDYLCFDSYKFDQIIRWFSQGSLVRVLINVLSDYKKLKAMANLMAPKSKKKEMATDKT